MIRFFTTVLGPWAMVIQRLWIRAGRALETERPRWVLWIPVALGIGIAWYFSCQEEPLVPFSYRVAWIIGLVALMSVGFLVRSSIMGFFSWGLFWIFLGFFLALCRTEHVNPRPLRESTGPIWISGFIEGIDHPASTHTLFQRIILRLDPPKPRHHQSYESYAYPRSCPLPKKAMITIRTACVPLLEGDRIRLKAVLNPLPGPCFPGAHDPARQFFFQGVGASGFATTGARILSRHPDVLSQWRHTLTRKLHAFLPPPIGAMACGLVTGDKIALPQSVRQEFSDSGLAHLLAIAGLHMSILSGLCFMVFQRTLAHIPRLALYVNLDRIAAVLSLGVGWVYLMISGQRYPVQRAFFMMAATMLSMIVGRRRHSMRILMLSAALFLMIQPESLLSLSFQLSFAAVGGLIGVYEWRMNKKRTEGWKPRKYRWPKPLLRTKRFVTDSLWSSGSITVMTWPIMVHHFYHISLQGVISNMVAIPFTAVVIMPMGLIALLFLQTPWASVMMGLWGMSLHGLIHIASCSARYGSWMIGWIRPYDGVFFAFEMLGICWLLLWQSRMRWWGIYLWAGAMALGFYGRTQPTFLIDSEHKMVAFVDYTEGKLWVSSLRRGKWMAQRWSQAFGVPHITLWPSEPSDCKAKQMPWYSTEEASPPHPSFGDIEPKNNHWNGNKRIKHPSSLWSLSIGSGNNTLLSNASPRAGCFMLDASGHEMGQPHQRPWTIARTPCLPSKEGHT